MMCGCCWLVAYVPFVEKEEEEEEEEDAVPLGAFEGSTQE